MKPEILIWARESAGFSLEQVAASSGLSKVHHWEAGELQPTINQLRLLGKKYKRSLAVFYLQEKPIDFQVISDFRRTFPSEMQRMSPQLALQIRFAQERREIAIEMLREMEDQVPDLSISATLGDSPEIVGEKVRGYLGIDNAEQRLWKNNRVAFNKWRSLIEDAGVLVLQMTGVETSEASGFAIADANLPVIAVNRGDSLTRRVFSLLHEFAHLILSKSGVSESYIDYAIETEIQTIETWCNAVAAATLLPREMFLGEKVVKNHEASNLFWPEKDIEALASTFNTSRISIVRRLLTLGLTEQSFYTAKEAEYEEQYYTALEKKKDVNQTGKFSGRNMSNEAFSLLGRKFVRIVLAPYRSDKVTLSDVSAYLNLKTKHIPKIEQTLLREIAN